MKKLNAAEMVERVIAGDRRIAARIITLVENEMDEHHEIMKLIYPHSGQAQIIGVTGVGGAGKSTLTNHIIRKLREQDKTIGVIVVDPSSPFSGGALLGDRIRMQSHTLDSGVFIRSMASRGYLGGLSKGAYDVIRIMEAMGRDVVIVETLGAGQDEIDVIHIAGTCLLVHTPNMGDDIQAMKAGIMEIADINVLNKADQEGADTSFRQLRTSINAANFKEGEWVPKIIATISVAGKIEDLKGIDELMDAIAEHDEYLHTGNNLEQVGFARVEQELGVVFKEKMEKKIYNELKGTGKKKEYITSIMEGRTDPYSVSNEVLNF
jgi:LAO/AO transport system kinase